MKSNVKESNKKLLSSTGERGSVVKLFLEQRKTGKKAWRYVVKWGSKEGRCQKSWPGDAAGRKAARQFFESYNKETATITVKTPLTTAELWAAYVTTGTTHLAVRSKALYKDAWQAWQRHLGAAALAENFNAITIGAFRAALEHRGWATATVKMTIQNIRTVYRWAEYAEQITKNPWHFYKFKVAKDKRTKRRAEFQAHPRTCRTGVINIRARD